jgi:hypothetical protein
VSNGHFLAYSQEDELSHHRARGDPLSDLESFGLRDHHVTMGYHWAQIQQSSIPPKTYRDEVSEMIAQAGGRLLEGVYRDAAGRPYVLFQDQPDPERLRELLEALGAVAPIALVNSE